MSCKHFCSARSQRGFWGKTTDDIFRSIEERYPVATEQCQNAASHGTDPGLVPLAYVTLVICPLVKRLDGKCLGAVL
jgi:hypothetical protein